MNSYKLTASLLVLTALVAGAGIYLIFVHQPNEMQAIEDERQVARMQQAEVQDMLVEHATTVEAADEAVAKWNARYKYIPRSINTPDIVDYLEGLTSRGFEAFNIRIGGHQQAGDISYYTFNVNGTAYYTNLYDFVWHIENNRDMYRIRDLDISYTPVFRENPETELQRRLDMVRFSLQLDAYYGGNPSLSTERAELIPISRDLLPDHNPAHNSFYPLVRDDLPPNDDQLLEIEGATLISISGGRATLEDSNGRHVVNTNDEIYLGHITQVDAANARVVARLNKGGVESEVIVEMESSEDDYQDARHGRQLVPIDN